MRDAEESVNDKRLFNLLLIQPQQTEIINDPSKNFNKKNEFHIFLSASSIIKEYQRGLHHYSNGRFPLAAK